MIVDMVMKNEPINTTIPSWKIELIKNRRKNKINSSASFSFHGDRSQQLSSPAVFKTVRHEEMSDGSVKTQDIINYFNKSTDGVDDGDTGATTTGRGRRVVNLSSSQSFQFGSSRHQQQRHQRRDAESLSTSLESEETEGDKGMFSGGGGTRYSRTDPFVASTPRPSALSRGLADERVTVTQHPSTSEKNIFQKHFTPTARNIHRSVSFSVVNYHNPFHDIIEDRSEIVEDEEDDELNWERFSNGYLDPEDHLMSMGEDTRLYISNGGGGAGAQTDRGRVSGGGVGARLYRGRQTTGRRNTGGRGLDGGGNGDSDGMMGSGGESDSSEEIHYGPGFVSRLKSRYMSVALRGSPRGTLGTLRRTASLEYFLDMDKECNVEEVELTTPPPLLSHKKGSVNTSKKESMKRAQSVEVLSLQSEKSSVVLPYTYFDGDHDRPPPPCESPPPLPPRDRDSPSVLAVLNNPALVNEVIIVPDKTPPKPTTKTSAKPLHQTGLISSNTRPKQQQHTTNAKTLPSKRASTGVLFGVKDKELPAPDIVKQTRKLFETNTGSGAGRRFSGAKNGSGNLTKAKSTSSLYTKPPSRSNSFDMPLSRTARKKSEEDLSQKPQVKSGTSPSRKYSRTNSSPARTPKLPSKPTPTKTTPRPALPAKPSHLVGNVKPTNSAIVDRHVQKVTPTKIVNSKNFSKSSPGLVKASVATVIPSDVTNRDLESKSIQLNLHPINSDNNTTENGSDTVGVKRVSTASIQNIRKSGSHVNIKFDDSSSSSAKIKTHLPGGDVKKTLPPKQVGVIRPISRDTDSSKVKAGPKTGLKENQVNRNLKVNSPDKDHDKEKETLIIDRDPLLVPIDTWKDNTQAKNYINKKIHSESSKEAPHVLVSNPVVTSGAAVRSPVVTNSDNRSPPSINRSPPSINRSPPTINRSPPSINRSPPTINRSPPSINRSPPSINRSPPSVPPRNGSKLEHSDQQNIQQKKYFDTNIEPHVNGGSNTTNNNSKSSDKVIHQSDLNRAVKISEPVTNGNVPSGDTTDKSSNYRDSWKNRNDVQNTLVFNFVNSKKDISHIENDGLDLTKRTKKGVIILDANGESCDGDIEGDNDDEKEPVECSNNFVFVGAEIRTGKSSIRSKQSKRKLNISFNDKTEVFEYPSFESVDTTDSTMTDNKRTVDSEDVKQPTQSSSSIFKTNSSVGSSGGLGSYTPSKIQMAESAFQLGVSRTNPSSKTPVSNNISNSQPAPETILLPADDGISWGSAASSDMLF